MGKYLDSSGITHLWSKIKAYIAGLGYTTNTGTVTGVKMNNGTAASPDANGVVDLGTVITDVSDKANTSHTHTVSQVTDFPANLITGTSQSYTVWSGTQAEYDALGTYSNTTLYFIKES